MSQCQHDLVIAPDPKDGTHEIVKCLKCGDVKRRLAAAESIRQQASDELATMRAEIAKMRANLDELREALKGSVVTVSVK